MSKCYWESGASRLAEGKVATNLQYVKNAVFPKHNEGKHNKIKYACA